MKIIQALLIAALITASAAAGLLDDFDYKVSDWLYQKQGAITSEIVVVGVDSKTISKLGSVSSWIRRDMAKVIDYMNSTAPPAVIGVDFLFTGDNPDTAEFDKQLTEVVAKYGNVVVASAIIADEDFDDPHAMWNQTWQWDSPFPALAQVANTGHICEPSDVDGIIRHQLLFVNTTERGRLYSFARVLYEKFCQAKNISPNPPPITENNGLYYLPFTAKSYTDISFVDLLEGKIDAEIYRDKIVLIGALAPGMGDEFFTALDRSAPVYGVNIHANAIQAFQKNFFPREAEKSLQLAILFIVSFISELFFRARKMQTVLIAWLIIFFGWLGLCKIFYSNEIILHVVWIPLAVSVLFIGSVAINYTRARAEKDKVTSTFGRYVDPTIMNQLLSSDEALDVGGTLRNIAVLFVDIRGFTTMSEQLSAPEVVEILNKYLTLTTDCIRRHHGTLDKFVGDCTMAFWNAPLTQDKPVLLACRAAVDMIKDSEELRAELKKTYGREIAFGVGVHWGSAVVGNIGSPFRMDYTAIGDTVNTAARLEANAPGGKIFISRAVADILGSQASVTSLGNKIKLKGKKEGFEVLTLDALKEEA
ncbi:MAG: adenylate/guanylate cyclase domain-containing protein [Selenomonadaceae bacterium]|nr:adenylate/guanylate cyclase domain-containing protein [Selenomonadaceae bacterium]